MDRYLLFMSWRVRRGEAGPEGLSGLTAESIYNLLETNCNTSLNAKGEDFPACSLGGIPGVKEWYFAIQSICGFSQFGSSDWEHINFDLETDQSKNTIRRNIEECLGDFQRFEEDDSNSQESLSLIDLYEESADSIHLLADRLPAPGRAMVDVILQSSERDVPKLKDCLPVIGALKHLREWHAAKITIVANESKIWQKVADYLSADIVVPENLKNSIDSRELWRGKIQIWERKCGSEITFPDFCIKGIAPGRQLSTLHLNSCLPADETELRQNTNVCLPEVFHYYCSALKFVQLVLLSHLPSYLVSGLQFELSLARIDIEEKSLLFWDQISSLRGKVGALFVLPCSVSGMLIPLPTQLSTKKWKEYIAQKPRVINVPEVELKGETCNCYFLVQGNGCGGCKATLIYSASQINGSVTLAETIGKLTTKTEKIEAGLFEEFVRSLPHLCGEQILHREKKLACVQTLALNHCLKSQVSARQLPMISADELKTLLTCTREHFLELWNTSHSNSVCPVIAVKTKGQGTVCDLQLKESNPLKWPERNVLQNLENCEKIKQKARVSEQLLVHKDDLKGSTASLDAKELLKYFTPEGLPIGDLQPLHIQKGENSFLLTPELTPRKLRSLPFEKAAGCHYHGLEYCLDNRRALERDVGFAELQTRLIRCETQTTCTKEYCPVPCVLSPLPSPAVLSEPGSVPDGESLQRELQTEASRLKRRSKDLDSFYLNKRLLKSESTDSLLSQANGSSGSRHSGVVTRQCQEMSVSLPSALVKMSHNRVHKVTPKSSSASQRGGKQPEILKPTKESRSQKHTRMLKEVVMKTLEQHGIADDHKCFATCSQRLFEISKCYLKDLKTSRGLFDEMKKAATSNVKQVIEWVLEKTKEK
ncbi:mdm2-binding protein isoform X2 [Rhineura floridana]|uniref:mdm2-binding protein isoform X2 n=1 Tax=Rhineura floridana TaxID=261503 RepID=UPI002AC84E6F|nr:mdm2-binding protein isoform X2 [Rhineura floridana]